MALRHRFTEEMIEEYIARRWWAPDSDIDWMLRNARRYPDKEAVVDQRNRFTWKQIKVASERLALRLLELGVKRNDVIVYQLPSSAEFYYVWYAALLSGTLGLPCLMQFREAEMEHLMKPTDATIVVTRSEFGGFNHIRMYEELKPKLPKLKHIIVVGDDVPEGMLSMKDIINEPIEEKYPRDYLDQFLLPLGAVGNLWPTSGTTGLPKITLANLGYAISGECLAEAARVTKDDVALACAGLASGPSGTLCGPFGATPYVGGKVVCLEKWDPLAALELIEKEKVTIGTGVPAMLIQMLAVPDMEKKYDLSSLRVWHYAGAVLSPEAVKEIEERMGCVVITFYGAIGGGILSGTTVYDPPGKRYHTIGKPAKGMEVEIRDEQDKPLPQGEIGEICFQGSLSCAGFWDSDILKEHIDDRHFYHIGDLGMFDEEGYLYVTGRKTDMIIRGGQNIMPSGIESEVLTHPKVADVAVVGMPDPVMGEKVCAYVIPMEGQTFTFEEMVSHLEAKKTAKFKLPERLEIVHEFPLSAGGKVSKDKLKEDITAKLEKEMEDK